MVAPNSSSLMLSQQTEGPNQEMDKDMFLQLMITQLQYQDPLEPMDNQEMLAQLAQFTSLEQMKNVADISNKQFATGMIGQYVSYTYTDEQGATSYLMGKVDYVNTKGSQVIIGIGGNEVTLDAIEEVYDASNIQSNASAFELLGKTVQAVIQHKNSETGKEEDIIIEGEVLQIEMKDSDPYVIIGTGDKKVTVSLSDVQNVVDKPSLTGKYVTGKVINAEGVEEQIAGTVEYIAIEKENTYLYVNGQFINFDDLETVQDNKPLLTSVKSSYNY